MAAVLHVNATMTSSESLQTDTLSIRESEERQATLMLRSNDPEEVADWILRVRRDPRETAEDLIAAHDDDGLLDDYRVDHEDFDVQLRNVGDEAVHRAAARRAEDNTYADNAADQLLRWLGTEADDGRIEEFLFRCRSVLADVYVDPNAGEF